LMPGTSPPQRVIKRELPCCLSNTKPAPTSSLMRPLTASGGSIPPTRAARARTGATSSGSCATLAGQLRASTRRGNWALPRPTTACCQSSLGMRDLSFSQLSTRRLRALLASAGRLPTSSHVPLTCTRLPLRLGCSALPPPLSASAPTPRPPLPPTQPRRPARHPPAARRRTPQGLADRQLLAAQ